MPPKINYKECISDIIGMLSAIPADWWDFINQNRYLSGPNWAQAADGSIDAVLTLRKMESEMTGRDLRGRTSHGDCTFRTLKDITSVPSRYLPLHLDPLAEGDYGYDLSDDNLVLLHFIILGTDLFRTPSKNDALDVMDNIIKGNTGRYSTAIRNLSIMANQQPQAYAAWFAMIHSPSYPKGNGSVQQTGPADRVTLREVISRYFSLDEIEGLCFDLGIDYDNIGGSSKPGKVLELIQYMDRRGQLENLTASVRSMRPGVI